MTLFRTEQCDRPIMRNKIERNAKIIIKSKFLMCFSIFLIAATWHVYAMASDIAFYGVNFNEKRPFINDKIEDALVNYKESLDVLKNDLPVIFELKKDSHIKIIGFTDNRECVGPECRNLSLRRAKAIYSWLLANGVSPSQLLPPEGRGSDDPVEDNKTSTGRARNRRVEFQVIPISPSS